MVWVQGCTLGCPGCFNGPTHPTKGGEVVTVAELVERILALGNTIEGVTISGGEPLQQLAGVTDLLRQLRLRSKLSVILFTGFSWDELERMSKKPLPGEAASSTLPLPILEDVDVLIAGRYEVAQHLAQDLRGSSNKRTFFLTERYTEADMQQIPPAEIVITPEGEVLMSGIDPLRW